MSMRMSYESGVIFFHKLGLRNFVGRIFRKWEPNPKIDQIFRRTFSLLVWNFFKIGILKNINNVKKFKLELEYSSQALTISDSLWS